MGDEDEVRGRQCVGGRGRWMMTTGASDGVGGVGRIRAMAVDEMESVIVIKTASARVASGGLAVGSARMERRRRRRSRSACEETATEDGTASRMPRMYPLR